MRRPGFALSILILLLPLHPFAAEPLYLLLPPAFDSTASVPDAVKSECNIDTVLGNDVQSAINERYGPVQAVTAPEQAADGRLLRLTILSIYAKAGGAWSGKKTAAIRADLMKGGTPVDSIYLNRATDGGFIGFGWMNSTCGFLRNDAAALGKDVAAWLQKRDHQAGSSP